MFALASPYLKVSLFAALLTTALMYSLNILAQQLPSPEKPVVEERRPAEMFGLARELMPLFPGCDDRLEYAVRKPCADSLLLDFIYGNLRYPYQAWQDSVEGMAVVSFTVEKDGVISDAKAVRDPGAGTGAEAVRLVNLMKKLNLRWTPGTQMGKPVRVRFNLPVRFKLADDERPVPPPPPPPPPAPPLGWDDVFTFVDKRPCLPGCESDENNFTYSECTDSLLRIFINDHLCYPEAAWKDSLEGFAVISFVIEKDGTVSNVVAIRKPGKGLEEEALRIVNLMNECNLRWVPARQEGRKVRVKFNLAVKFKMSEHESPFSSFPPPPSKMNCSDIFRIVDEMPRFPGCEDIDDEYERKTCSDKKLVDYLWANLQLTPLQTQSCVTGTAVIQFVIEKDGTISGAKIMRDIGVGYGQSALKAVESMNENNICWTPGRQSGRPVRVQYNVPVRIKWE